MKNLGLYIHIPFCKQKCIYCAFTSFCNENDKIQSYFNKLKEELILHKEEITGKTIKTIYIGGGTPSFVDAKLIKDLLLFVKNEFNVGKNTEISIETNPDSITLEKAKMWKNCGINRVSVGLQSISNITLKRLNRPHTVSDYENAIKILKDVGFKNINSDILIGLPKQTKQEIKNTITFLNKQGLTHISAYGLMIENETPLKKMVEEKKVDLTSEEKAVELYNVACSELQKYGYNRYEISNFSKDGFECQHNQNYWDRGEFLGVGVSAYSFIKYI